MQTIDLLLASIEEVPQGISLAQLSALHPEVPRRTLQRMLATLIVDGRIIASFLKNITRIKHGICRLACVASCIEWEKLHN